VTKSRNLPLDALRASATLRDAGILRPMKIVGVLTITVITLMFPEAAKAQVPNPAIVDSPNVKVLTGLTAQQFQEEMNFIVQGLGVTCGTCHVRGNFASEDKPQKQTARKMLEMVKAINKANFPDYKPKDGESVLGRVTCYTCHRGETSPKTSVGQ
jgi:hypothetical protein